MAPTKKPARKSGRKQNQTLCDQSLGGINELLLQNFASYNDKNNKSKSPRSGPTHVRMEPNLGVNFAQM